MTKICTKCFCEKVLSDFYWKKSGKPASWCKSCIKLDVKRQEQESPGAQQKRNQKYYADNSEKAKAEALSWYKNNTERARASMRAFYSRNKKERQLYQKKWLAQNGQAQRNCKIAGNLRSRCGALLNGTSKSAATIELLGCTIEEHCVHLESQFHLRPGMSWETRPFWHIDHIKPCDSFPDLSDPAQQRACFHYTNLRPIWAIENLQKANKYAG